MLYQWSAVISLHNGTTDRETLWENFRAQGDVNTMWRIQYEVVTKDTYQDFMARYSLDAWRDEITTALAG